MTPLITKLLILLAVILLLSNAITAKWAINEAARSSEYSQQSYKNGQRDAELFIKGQIIKAQIEQEIIQEAKEHLAEERL